MAKFTLDFELDYNFTLIGISSHLQDYRLCWLINQALSWDFIKQDYHQIIREDIELEFARFDHGEDSENAVFTILSNRCEHGFLIPEKQGFDYFLIVEGHISQRIHEHIVQSIGNIPNINVVQELIPEDLRSKQNLILT